MPASKQLADAQATTTAWASALPLDAERPPATRDKRSTLEEAQAVVESEAFQQLLGLEPRLHMYLSRRFSFDEQTNEDILSVVRERWLHQLRREPLAPQRLHSYLYAIVRNAAVDHMRRTSRQREVLTDSAGWDTLESQVGHERSPEDIVTDSVMHEGLLAKVQGLPYMQRRVIELIFLQGLSTRETSEHLGITAATAQRYRLRALKTLRNMYLQASPGIESKP